MVKYHPRSKRFHLSIPQSTISSRRDLFIRLLFIWNVGIWILKYCCFNTNSTIVWINKGTYVKFLMCIYSFSQTINTNRMYVYNTPLDTVYRPVSNRPHRKLYLFLVVDFTQIGTLSKHILVEARSYKSLTMHTM